MDGWAQAFSCLHEVQRNGVGITERMTPTPTHTHTYTCEDTDVHMYIHEHRHTQTYWPSIPEHTGFFSALFLRAGCSGGKDSVINWVWDTRHLPFCRVSLRQWQFLWRIWQLKSPFPSAFSVDPVPAALGVSGDAAPLTPALALGAAPPEKPPECPPPPPSLRTPSPQSPRGLSVGMLLGKSPSFPSETRGGCKRLSCHQLRSWPSQCLCSFAVWTLAMRVGFLMAWVLCQDALGVPAEWPARALMNTCDEAGGCWMW